jgi:predicted nucleic acid-binding protein
VIVADSDVLIDALAGREPAAARVRQLVRSRRLATTSISRFELLAGARDDDERDTVRALLDAIPALVFDAPAADRAADAGRTLTAGGTPLPMADLAIAGICLSLEVPLLSRNVRHFERIEGLEIAAME